MAISIPPKGDADKKICAYFAPLSVEAQDAPNMTVKIRAGTFFNTLGVAVEYSGGNSPVISAPASNAKWVIVGITDTTSISIINGVASASPVVPTIPDGTMPLAYCYVVSTATSLGNDRIYDMRPLFQSTNSVPNLDAELAIRPTFTDMNNELATKADLDGTPNYTWFLNKGDGPQTDALLTVKRGIAPDVSIRWNETLDQWEITNDGSTYDAIGTSGGSFMPTVPGATDGNLATFLTGVVVDSGTVLSDLATDAELAAGLALKADDLDLTAHENDATIHFTLPITQASVTDLVTDLAGKADLAGDTFTGDITVEVAPNQAITLSSRDTGSSGLLIDRTGVPGPDAILEWDESTDQWLAGTIGSAFPILTAENLGLADLTDVEDALAPSANDVLRYVGGEWTSDPLADFLLLAGGTMTGALVLAAGTVGLPALSFTSDATKGMYDSGAGEVSFAIAGAQKVLIDASGVTTFSGFIQGSALGGMALWNAADATTGIVFPATGEMEIHVGGAAVAQFGGTPGVNTALIASDIGVTVQGYDATIVVDADIGVNIQAYDADLDAISSIAAGDGIIQRTGGVWAAAALTGGQVNTALGYTAADASTLSTHTGDATIHFTQAAISVPLSQGANDVTATAAEVNKADQSAETETIDAAGTVSASLRITQISSTGAGAVTLAVPDASMIGHTKVIEMTGDIGDITLATTNIVGSGGATITFDDVGDTAVLVGGVAAWIYVAGTAVIT